MNKNILLGATALTCLAVTPALAVEGLNANAAVTSNYVWRGISQTSDEAAVQAGVDYALPGTGFAVGAWASSLNFQDGFGLDDDAPLELDIYASYTGEIVPMFSYRVGVIGYLYPEQPSFQPDYDFVEFFGGLTYDFDVAALSGTVYYSPDAFGGTGDSWYFSGDVTVPAGEFFAFKGHLGYFEFDTGVDYTDWSLGVSATLDEFTLTLAYTDTDVTVISPLGDDLSDEAFVATLSFVTE